MKKVLAGALGVAGVAVGMIGAATTAAADNTDYPLSCLEVQNHTGVPLAVSLNYPAGYDGTWWFDPGADQVVLWNGQAITSPSGAWNIYVGTPHSDMAWAYDVGRNVSWGCHGSWIVTVN